MGVGSKRVQASLSSFFRKKESADAAQAQATQERAEEVAVVTPPPAKRPRVTGASSKTKTKTNAVETLAADTPDAPGNGQGEEEGDRQQDENEDAAATQMSQLSIGAQLSSTHVQLVRRQAGIKYTPLEEQVLLLKQQHASSVLMVEVGYKFRFFGEDARIASHVLSIMCTQQGAFYSASVPTPRMRVHLRRLVHAGYRVAVARQEETRALKAAGGNRSAPFTR
ncbi:Mismatch repair protein msh3, partial [Coemansia sp. RSA 2703]